MTKGHRFTKGSVNEIARRLSAVRGNRYGNTGESDGPDNDEDRGPWLGIAQANIPSGQTGGVNFFSGPKGSEADSKVTVQVFNRFDTILSGQWVLFDSFDQGYEVVHAPEAATGQNIAACNCQDCVQTNPPPSWGFVWTAPGSLPANTQYTLSGGGPYTSPPFTWAGKSGVTWVLTVGADSTDLVMQVDATHSITYRTPAISWAPQCANTMYLYNPSQLPSGSTTSPCSLCIVPSDQFYGGNCNICPKVASFTISGISGPYACLNGTWEISLTAQSDFSCFGSMTISGITILGTVGDITMYLGRAGGPGNVAIGVYSNQTNGPEWVANQDGNFVTPPPLPCSGDVTLVPAGGNGGRPYGNITVTFA